MYTRTCIALCLLKGQYPNFVRCNNYVQELAINWACYLAVEVLLVLKHVETGVIEFINYSLVLIGL